MKTIELVFTTGKNLTIAVEDEQNYVDAQNKAIKMKLIDVLDLMDFDYWALVETVQPQQE
jgi:hypothetical protein